MATTISELLDPKSAAAALHTTYGTLAVWRCTRRKSLPFVRIGRKIFYTPDSIQKFIDANTHPGDGPRPAVEPKKRAGR
jgi:hypothetical protein